MAEIKTRSSLGWISIHRGIVNHWVFDNPKYFQWWVLMIMKVNFKEKKFVRNGEIFNIKQGQSVNCLRTWGILFNAAPKTVSRFFDLLVEDEMITRSSIGKGKQALTLINVVNYSDYQDTSKQEVNTKETQTSTQSKHRLPTNNKGNKVNNDNNVNKYIETPSAIAVYFSKEFHLLKDKETRDWFIEFLKQKKNKNGSLSELAIRKNLNNLKKLSDGNKATAKILIAEAADKGWKDFYPKKETQTNFNPPKLKILDNYARG